MKEHFTVKQLPQSEQPYERFEKYGVENLSDAELLAIVIKSGTARETSVDLASRILSQSEDGLLNLYRMTFDDFLMISGIGKVKAMQLKCVAELSRRISEAHYLKEIVFTDAMSIANYYMERLRHESNERVLAIFFDTKFHLICDYFFSTGSSSFAFFPYKEILKMALLKNATHLVVIHNHPSGDPTPSRDDIRVTNHIKKASELIDVIFDDHIVIGDMHYYSFKEHELI